MTNDETVQQKYYNIYGSKMFKNEKLLIFINGKSISEIFLQAYFLLCIMLGGVFLATKLAWKMIGHCFNGNFFSTFCVHMLWLSIFCQSLSSFFSIEEILTFSNVCWWDEKNPIFDFAVRKRMGKTSNIVYFFVGFKSFWFDLLLL